jgi:hypothetical protein
MTRRISDLPPPNKAQHPDEQHGQHEQRDGGAMRHVAGKDTDLEPLEAKDRGCVYGAAVGQKKDDGKVGKRKHDPENQADSHDRKDHRQDDLVVAALEAGTVDRRRIDHILRYGSDAGQDDNDRKWKEPPGIDDDHAQHRQMWIAESIRRLDKLWRNDTIDLAKGDPFWRPTAQNIELVPKNEDFGLQCRPRPE